ncbi:MAG: hypothetical protein ACREQY_01990, partial [Candidatus Binatia bacterium]
MSDALLPALVGLFAAGIGLSFLVADWASPSSRALALALGGLGAIYVSSPVRESGSAVGVFLSWALAALEALTFVAFCEWFRRIARTATTGAGTGETPLRVGQALGALHGLAGLLAPPLRERFAGGGWSLGVVTDLSFWAFLGPIAAATVAAGIGVARVVSSGIDEAERVRIRATGFASPFLASGFPMQPPWEYVTTAIGELVFLAGSMRYYVMQGAQAEFAFSRRRWRAWCGSVAWLRSAAARASSSRLSPATCGASQRSRSALIPRRCSGWSTSSTKPSERPPPSTAERSRTSPVTAFFCSSARRSRSRTTPDAPSPSRRESASAPARWWRASQGSG